jgi:hypothetical protein
VGSKRSSLWIADPAKLGEVLMGERGPLVDVLLRALPANLAAAIHEHLPTRRAHAQREIKPQVLDVVREKLDEIVRRDLPKRKMFRFSDVKLLNTRELLCLCEWLGMKVLGPAVAGLPEAEQEALVAPLSPEFKEGVMAAVSASARRGLLPQDAAELIALHQEGGRSSRAESRDFSLLDALRSAGAQRLVRACMAQSLEFAVGFLERHRAELPSYFVKWFREEKGRTIQRGDGGRAEIVVEMEILAERGWIEMPSRPPALPGSAPPSTAPARSMSRPMVERVSTPRIPELPVPELPPPRDSMGGAQPRSSTSQRELTRGEPGRVRSEDRSKTSGMRRPGSGRGGKDGSR